MIRKLVCALFMMTVAIGFVMADEFTATVTKVDGNKITYQKYKKGAKGKKGEKDVWGKPAVPVYEPLGHIPLLIAWPGAEPRAVDALTTTVDLFATLAEIFAVAPRHRTHGRSLVLRRLDLGSLEQQDAQRIALVAHPESHGHEHSGRVHAAAAFSRVAISSHPTM